LARRRGLTLVEVLIVMSIVAILIAIGVPTVRALRESARRHACGQQLRRIALKLREYYEQKRRYPLSLRDLYSQGFVQEASLLRCPSDPRREANFDDPFYGYDLFYASRDPSESKDALAGGCAFHGGDRGLVVFLDGTVEEARFDKAKLTSATGQVEVRPREKVEWVPAEVGMELRPGDAIRTGPGGRAEIAFFGETSKIEVLEDTILVIKLLLRDPDTLGLRRLLGLLNGSIWCDVDDNVYTEENNSFEVVTPSVVAGVRGTRFYISVTNEILLGKDIDGDGRKESIITYIHVSHGRVLAKFKGQRIRLRARESLRFELRMTKTTIIRPPFREAPLSPP